MNQKLVFARIIALTIAVIFVLPSTDCLAQRNAGRRAEKELFGRTKTGRSSDEALKPHGKAAKAIKEQKKKESRRDKEDEKTLMELRKKHFERQSEATKARMLDNSKKTEAAYKAKKQKQKKEQRKPARHRKRKP